MPTFRVIIEEFATYEREIVARTKAEAIKKAEEHFLSANGLAIGEPWSCDVQARETIAERVK